jgi:hypothetical protein
MKARCRISTRVRQAQTAPTGPKFDGPLSILRFPTDSKQLSSFLRPYFHLQRPSVPTFLEIGLERANRGMPANSNVFHLEAARREL